MATNRKGPIKGNRERFEVRLSVEALVPAGMSLEEAQSWLANALSGMLHAGGEAESGSDPVGPVTPECAEIRTLRHTGPAPEGEHGQLDQAILFMVRRGTCILREDIARMVGEDEELVSRRLQSLKRRGYLTYSSRNGWRANPDSFGRGRFSPSSMEA